MECAGKEQDLGHLKHKVDSGADFVVTQLFFVNDDYFSFVERARAVVAHQQARRVGAAVDGRENCHAGRVTRS